MQYKIGVYTRVSTDEQALRSEGSLETQRLRILAEIENRNRRDAGWGKAVGFYEDDGYSAAGYRPAYERLLNDVRKGKVNLIFVADYFRFCRNLLGYLQLAEQLKAIGAKILSVKDNFDTETAMGQSMIRNYINMAQTERELTAERVATNFHARALRGLRNGGKVLFGFERDDGDLARLKINEKEAAEIREVFNVFLEEGTCPKAVARLNQDGPRHRIKNYNEQTASEEPWSNRSLLYLLRNPIYAGLREVNKKNKEKDQQNLREFMRYQIVAASWPAIIDEVTWKTTQESLDFAHAKARAKHASGTRREFLLTGLLRCAECGERLMGASGHGRQSTHRYYIHRPVKGKKVTCSMNWIPAEALEDPVIERIGLVLKDEGYLDQIEGKVANLTDYRRKNLSLEKSGVESDLARIESDIKKVIRLQTQCDDATVDEVFRDQLKSLSDEKRKAKARLSEIEYQIGDLVDAQAAREAIKANATVFDRAFKKANGTIRKRLLGFVFDAMTLGNCELNLFHSPTAFSAAAVQEIQSAKSSEQSSGGFGPSSKVLQFKKSVRRNAALGPLILGNWDEAVGIQSIWKIGRRGGI